MAGKRGQEGPWESGRQAKTIQDRLELLEDVVFENKLEEQVVKNVNNLVKLGHKVLAVAESTRVLTENSKMLTENDEAQHKQPCCSESWRRWGTEGGTGEGGEGGHRFKWEEMCFAGQLGHE